MIAGTETVAAEDLLALGDDALVLSHRLTEWVARAPEIEEDVALANIALDLLGHARGLLTRAGEVEGAGRDEDDLAYLRGPGEFRCCRLVELRAADFAEEVARLLLVAAYQHLLYPALASAPDPEVAGIAAKAATEVAYHRDHAMQWALRLGDGTPESHRRMEAAVHRLWPLAGQLFSALPGRTVDVSRLRAAWLGDVSRILGEATLRVPDTPPVSLDRRGPHSAELAEMLTEKQSLHRAHPGAVW